MRPLALLAALSLTAAVPAARPAPEPDAAVDFGKAAGKIKPLHGVNGSPVSRGENADLAEYHAAAGFPHVRLHDVHWPCPDAVDISTIFPLFHADPDDPKNYTFAKTDDTIAAIVKNKGQVVFRLGESIEPWTRFHNAPPKDFAKWAKVCVNVVRHYNDGWANGFKYGIRYWEVWNEPEAAFMWTGTRDQYFELYETTARALKGHDPKLMVGGPAATDPDGPWVEPFLAFCRDRKVPLDFFSWHLYRGTPKAVTDAAALARKTLDKYGFTKAESHLNEWRYWTTWAWLRPKDPAKYPEVKARFAESVGPEGAAFAANVLMLLQDQPLDVANFYSADNSPWGMFDTYGIPSKTYFAFRAFNELARRPNRVAADGPPWHGVVVRAGVADDKKSAAVLVGSFKGDPRPLTLALRNLPWGGNTTAEAFWVDTDRDLAPAPAATLRPGEPLRLDLPVNGVCLVKLGPGGGGP